MQLIQRDKLYEIFVLQIKLHDRLIAAKRYPPTIDKQVSGLCTAIIHEAVELQRLTSWKWWKQIQPIDYQKAREELADIWHFVVDLSLVLGLTPEKLVEEYQRKNLINHKRLDEGY